MGWIRSSSKLRIEEVEVEAQTDNKFEKEKEKEKEKNKRGWSHCISRMSKEKGKVKKKMMSGGGGEDRNLSSLQSEVPTKKVIIKSADMLPDMQKEAVDIAVSSFDKYHVEKEVAEHIKKEFDKRHGPTWHCIVGRNFGSYVTHETNHFVYFYLDQKAVLLFKSG